jgi:cytochrome c553
MNAAFTFHSVRRRHSTPHTDPNEDDNMNIRRTIAPLAATLALSFSAAGIAGPREDQLDTYARAAKAANPAFSGFSSARGNLLHKQVFAGGKADTPACTSCHGSDARGAGRNPAGKAIDPMALSASPSRYTDPAKVEKWFKRNCNEVLGRECTPLEKGDWLSFMASQ